MELIAEGLRAAYGRHLALDGVSLRAGPGVLALLGPNGAGKTTLLRLLATAAQPDAGRICFAGRAYNGDPRPLRRVLGYLPQELDLPAHLTPRAFLRYVAQLKGVPAEPQASTLLRALGLGDLLETPIGSLSGGQQRLVGIAQALLGRPRLLVLDEPLVGLDIEERERAFRQIAGPPGERVVVVSAHVPADVEAIASQVVVLRAGCVVASGTPAALRATAAGRVHEVTVPVAAIERMVSEAEVSRVTMTSDHARLRIVGRLPAGLAGTPVAPTLEDAYLLLQGA